MFRCVDRQRCVREEGFTRSMRVNLGLSLDLMLTLDVDHVKALSLSSTTYLSRLEGISRWSCQSLH